MELLRHGLVGASQVPKCLVGLGVALAPQDALDGLTWDVDQAMGFASRIQTPSRQHKKQPPSPRLV